MEIDLSCEERIERKNNPSRAREVRRIAAGDIWATWPVSNARHRGVSKVLMNRIELDH